ncbi:excinuclease ABC subunit UvrC [Trichothermofontia sichuanensis]|uniref:excinuclease ABC subunit UvrC n=1 Tax=Trichothermofontia sichuanensis TaxID=3045816 RepID=UPI0028F3F61C|nr:excinuclease ABC subunit UvrC [Trichothermofontia sichuanensis]
MTMTPPATVLIQDPSRLEARLREIPAEPGVYLMRDRDDRILYIGKSKKLRTRVRSYFRELQRHSPRIELMVRQVVEIEFIVTDTEAEALALEANLVKQHQPHFNVLLKDDKKYPYLCITWSEDYPRIFITRKRRLDHARDRYYGPYVDTHTLRSTLHLVKRIFPLRQRPQPLFKDRPCLNYDIGRCPGVCQQLISPEEYRKTVQKVAMVFQGRSSELVDSLTQQMEQAAEALNFELAAKLRDQIAALKSLNAEQKVALPDDTVSRDAIALASNGEYACIQLFQIRAGRLVGRLGFVAEVPAAPVSVTPQDTASGGIEIPAPPYPPGDANPGQTVSPEAGMILQRVLEEHYQTVDPVEIPAEILVQHELPETDLLAAYLSERKGRKVTIVAPQRQTKAELLEMVERNAAYELERTQKTHDRTLQALQDLAEVLDLPSLPHRIEGYDISHLQGADAVASQVVFINGLPAKQHYRHYKIRDPNVKAGHSDDFASLAEVIRRRFRKYANRAEPSWSGSRRAGASGHSGRVVSLLSGQAQADLPDLVMIDGGKGQLSAVVAVLRELNLLDDLRVVSLAKQREEIFLPGESLPLTTHPDQPGVQLLRRLRDEAHRFAVSFHRQQRSDRLRRSRLDDIPGLGFYRQKQLLAHFHSIDYIRAANPTQLAAVPGIGPRLAQAIYDYFHPASPE